MQRTRLPLRKRVQSCLFCEGARASAESQHPRDRDDLLEDRAGCTRPFLSERATTSDRASPMIRDRSG
jgi:hypothetical protein